MAKEIIQLTTDEEVKKMSWKQKLSSGELTREVYEQLSDEEKEQVRTVLFEQHSEPVATPVSLSSLEFTIFGLAKIFFKINSDNPLTADELAFYDRFKNYIEQHEMTMNAGDWYVPYAEANMLAARQNREEYKTKKLQITGGF